MSGGRSQFLQFHDLRAGACRVRYARSENDDDGAERNGMSAAAD